MLTPAKRLTTRLKLEILITLREGMLAANDCQTQLKQRPLYTETDFEMLAVQFQALCKPTPRKVQ